MTLISENINKLVEIKSLLQQLPTGYFTNQWKILSDASIGQHIRHILEFYICLERGLGSGTVCYDKRERNVLVETDVKYVVKVTEKAIGFLSFQTKDYPLILEANYSKVKSTQEKIKTSLYRELAYILDHTIHHLAVIKIPLIKENIQIDPDFGVAPSTIRNRSKCAQ